MYLVIVHVTPPMAVLLVLLSMLMVIVTARRTALFSARPEMEFKTVARAIDQARGADRAFAEGGVGIILAKRLNWCLAPVL